jgi:Flp pilus assembly protein TadD/ketosteroid isomerase-like protein
MPRAISFEFQLTALQRVCAAAGLALCAAAVSSQPLTPAAASPTAPMTASPEAAEVQRLIREGQNSQALKLIDEVLTRNPKDPQMRFRRGVALSMLDRKPEALTVFQKLVDDHPDMPAPYNNMAVILGSMGEYDKARIALDKAIRTNPAYATAYQNLGDVYAQLASQAYAKALSLDKTDSSVQPKLALLRELTSGPNVAPPSLPTPPTAAPVAAASPPKPTKPVAEVVASTKAAPAPAAPEPKASVRPGTPPKAVDPASAEVEAAVKSWAAAWSARNMEAYFAAYSPEFKGQTSSRKAWEQDRRDRIASRKNIKVDITDLRIQIQADRAVAKFRQSYASDALTTSGRKTLTLVRSERGAWLVKQEAVGG